MRPERCLGWGKSRRISRGALFSLRFSLRVSVSPCENLLACGDMGRGMGVAVALASGGAFHLASQFATEDLIGVG